MKTFRSISLIFLSLVISLGLEGCYMSQYNSAGKIDVGGDGYQELRAFPPDFKKALYRAEMSVNGHEFAGLMMIKSFPDNSFRLAFFNELGMNFFDFELRKVDNKNKLNLYINNIYSPLDKKILLNSLEKYFSMLLSPGLDKGVYKSFLKKDGSKVMIKVNAYKGKDAYLSRNLIEPYTEIINIGSLRGHDKIIITLPEKKVGHAPENILIEQAGLRMRFLLEFIPE